MIRYRAFSIVRQFCYMLFGFMSETGNLKAKRGGDHGATFARWRTRKKRWGSAGVGAMKTLELVEEARMFSTSFCQSVRLVEESTS